VLLDKVSEAALLSPAQLATLPQTDWLRIIASTRLGRDPLHASVKSLAFIAVDSLDGPNALALIRDQQFTSPVEETAARVSCRPAPPTSANAPMFGSHRQETAQGRAQPLHQSILKK
jgi:hypothetical protein